MEHGWFLQATLCSPTTLALILVPLPECVPTPHDSLPAKVGLLSSNSRKVVSAVQERARLFLLSRNARKVAFAVQERAQGCFCCPGTRALAAKQQNMEHRTAAAGLQLRSLNTAGFSPNFLKNPEVFKGTC